MPRGRVLLLKALKKAIRKRQDMVNLCSSSPATNGGSIQKKIRARRWSITRNQPRGAKLKIYRSGSSSLIWCDFQLCQRIIIIEYKSNEYMLSYCMFKHCISYSLCKKCLKIIQKKNKRGRCGTRVGILDPIFEERFL